MHTHVAWQLGIYVEGREQPAGEGSFHCVGPEDWTQLLRLVGKHLYLFPGPADSFKDNLQE